MLDLELTSEGVKAPGDLHDLLDFRLSEEDREMFLDTEEAHLIPRVLPKYLRTPLPKGIVPLLRNSRSQLCAGIGD